MALVIVFTIFMKNQYKRIREVTEYAKLVQSQDYTLDIRDNSEGDISILKNEIYKITTLLREQAEALRADKIKLSDSIADISHQLKTPLTSLIVLNDLLSGDPDPQTRQEFLHRAESQLERMQWLVSSLLKLSKLEAGTVVMKKELVSARSLIEKALEPLMVQIDSKQLNVIIGNDSCNKTQSADMNEINGSDHCAVDDVSFTGDFNWTLEAVTNIIKNCVEHTPNGGQIFISYDDNPIYTSIVISDNGKGIHKSDLPFIFQRFYKGRNAGDDSVGIGLAMAKAIINEQNGDITVDSELGKGTAFSIKFYKSS
ncbi:MAG TPA: HAMP domain-containing histidine kinase [Clostridiales bacterium]|nr:HAMP domain-containing histidine kinase [Clostridiales bacterium]